MNITRIFIGDKKSNLVLSDYRAACYGDDELKDTFGITHVLNVGARTIKHDKLKSVHKPIIEDADYKTFETWTSKCLDMLTSLDKDDTVLIHCEEGVNRSCCIIVLYLCSKYDMTVEDAIRIIDDSKHDPKWKTLNNTLFSKYLVKTI